MTDSALKVLIDRMGLYYDPAHPDYIDPAKVERLPLPFLEYELEEVPFFADGVCYYTREQLRIRLYTDTVTKRAEKTVSEVLTAAELAYQVKREFLPDLEIWQTIFTTEV